MLQTSPFVFLPPSSLIPLSFSFSKNNPLPSPQYNPPHSLLSSLTPAEPNPLSLPLLHSPHPDTHIIASAIPLYCVSWEPLVSSCSRVFTTSKGLTAKAASDPEAQPARKEHQNTASPGTRREGLLGCFDWQCSFLLIFYLFTSIFIHFCVCIQCFLVLSVRGYFLFYIQFLVNLYKFLESRFLFYDLDRLFFLSKFFYFFI